MMKNECKVYPPRFISVFHGYFHTQICKNESEITSYTGAEFWALYVPKNQYSGRILKDTPEFGRDSRIKRKKILRGSKSCLTDYILILTYVSKTNKNFN